MPKPAREGIDERRLDPRWQAVQQRITLLLWLLIIGTPLLLFIGLNLRQPRLDPAVVQTGDAVFDDYLLLLWRSGGLRQPLVYGQRPWISNAAWEELARRHVGDPRLYDLRSHVYLGAPSTPNWDYRDSLNIQRQAQDMAAAAGVTTARLQLRSFKDQLNDWLGEAEKELEDKQPGAGAAAGEQESWLRLVYGLTLERHGAEVRAGLAELRALAPDDAAPYYYEAWLASRAADYQWAREAFTLGNQQPRCTTLRGCPLDAYHELIAQGSAPPDKLVGASLAQLEYMDSGIDHHALRQTFTRTLQYCMREHDLDLLEEMHTALCRSARAAGQGNFDSLLICEQLNNIAQLLPTQSWLNGSSPAISQLSADSQTMYNYVRSSLTSGRSRQYWSHQQGTPLQSLQNMFQLRLNAIRGSGLEAALYQDSLDWNLQIVPGGQLCKNLQHLEDFDCRTKSWNGTPAAKTQP